MTKRLVMRLYHAQLRLEKVRALRNLRGWDRRRLEFVESVLAEARVALNKDRKA